MFMCKPHWYSLPQAVRDAVRREYREGQETTKRPTARYMAVQRRAIAMVAFKPNDEEAARISGAYLVKSEEWRARAIQRGEGDPLAFMDKGAKTHDEPKPGKAPVSTGPYAWCAELARADDDVLGTALAQVRRPPGVSSVRHKRVRETYENAKRETYAGDLERWHLFIAVVFEEPADANAMSETVPGAQRPVEETHWQFALALHQAAERYTGAWATLERFLVADARLREWHKPAPGVVLPLPPPRAPSVTVGGARATKHETPAEALAPPSPSPQPQAPTTQRSLF